MRTEKEIKDVLIILQNTGATSYQEDVMLDIQIKLLQWVLGQNVKIKNIGF